MFGIGTGELVMILIIAMLVVGPEKMVQLSKQFGQLVAKFRQQTESVTQEFREALTLEMDDKDEDEAAPQLPSGTEIQPASAPPAEAASSAVAESAAELAPASVAAEPAPEDQITADELLQVELEASMFDGEIDIAVASISPENASRDAISDQAIDLDVAELVPEDVDVQPMLIEEPVLIADEPASEAAEPVEDKA